MRELHRYQRALPRQVLLLLRGYGGRRWSSGVQHALLLSLPLLLLLLMVAGGRKRGRRQQLQRVRRGGRRGLSSCRTLGRTENRDGVLCLG